MFNRFAINFILFLLSVIWIRIKKKRIIPYFFFLLFYWTAVFFVLPDDPVLLVCYALLSGNLLLLSLEDMEYRSIPWYLLPSFFILALTIRFILGFRLSLLLSLLISFIFMGIPFLVFKKKGIGTGDLLVFTGLAVLFSPVAVIFLGTDASALGLLYAVYLKLVKKEERRIAFIPFINVAFLILMFVEKDGLPFKF